MGSFAFQHKEPKLYYVQMTGHGVRGIRLPIFEDIFHLTESGDGWVIMDLGTTASRFPKVAYEAFCDAFIAQTMDIPRAPELYMFDTCFSLPTNLIVMPSASFHFWSDIDDSTKKLSRCRRWYGNNLFYFRSITCPIFHHWEYPTRIDQDFIWYSW